MEYWNHSVRQSGICNDILDEKAEEIRERRRQRAQWKNGFGAWIDRSFFSGEKRRLALDINR